MQLVMAESGTVKVIEVQPMYPNPSPGNVFGAIQCTEKRFISVSKLLLILFYIEARGQSAGSNNKQHQKVETASFLWRQV